MATDPRGHDAPAPGEPPRRSAINDLSLSINDVVMVTNATERAQALVDIGSSAARPLIVRQQDTGEFWQHDGTAWGVIMLPPTSASFTLDTSLWSPTGTTQLKRAGLTWWLSLGFLQKAAGPISGAAWTSVGTVGTDARVAAGGIFMGSARVSAPDNAAISRINRATGVVEILATVASGTTSTSYNLGITWPAV